MSSSTTPVAGKLGQALKFDNVNDEVVIGTNATLNLTGAVTVSAWVKLSAGLTSNDCFACNLAGEHGDTTEKYSLYTGTSANMGRFQVGNGTTVLNSDTASTALQIGIWNHLVGTYNGTDTTTLYLNGVRVDTDTSANFGALNSSTGTFTIASNNGSGFIGGTMDEVRVYSRVLSAAEVQRLYQMGR